VTSDKKHVVDFTAGRVESPWCAAVKRLGSLCNPSARGRLPETDLFHLHLIRISISRSKLRKMGMQH
jgi:hypothetical protein